jgi:hypothetical protein
VSCNRLCVPLMINSARGSLIPVVAILRVSVVDRSWCLQTLMRTNTRLPVLGSLSCKVLCNVRRNSVRQRTRPRSHTRSMERTWPKSPCCNGVHQVDSKPIMLSSTIKHPLVKERSTPLGMHWSPTVVQRYCGRRGVR